MYVKRDEQGQVEMVSRELTAECDEWLEADSAELLAFLSPGASDPQPGALKASDLELIRVIEDLIELLTDQGVIRFTDLPEAAQQKLMGRKSLRASARSLNLVGDDDGDDGLL